MARNKAKWVAGRGYDKRVIAFLPRARMLFQEVRVRGGERIPPHFHARADEHFFVFDAQRGLRFLNGRKWFALRKSDYFVVRKKTIHAVDASKTKTKNGGPAAVFFVAKTSYDGDDSVWL